MNATSRSFFILVVSAKIILAESTLRREHGEVLSVFLTSEILLSSSSGAIEQQTDRFSGFLSLESVKDGQDFVNSKSDLVLVKLLSNFVAISAILIELLGSSVLESSFHYICERG